MTSVSTSSEISNTETWASLGGKSWEHPSVAPATWFDMTQKLHKVLVQAGFAVVDSIAKSPNVRPASSLAISDGNSAVKALTFVLQERLGVTDAQSFAVSQAISELLAVGSEISNGLSLRLADAFGVVGGKHQMSFTSVHHGCLSIADARVVDFAQSITELLPIATLASKDVSFYLWDAFGATDSHSNKPTVNAHSEFALSDGEDVVRRMHQNLLRTIGVEGAIGNHAHTRQVDAFKVVDAIAKHPKPNFLQDLAIVDDWVFGIHAVYSTTLPIRELAAKRMSIPKNASVRIASQVAKRYEQCNASDLAFVEVFDRVTNYIRDFQEVAAFVDVLAKAIEKNEARHINIAEQLVVPAWMVIADVLATGLKDGEEYTFENFMQSLDTGAMPGWTPWRNFVPGDYEYSKAMFRVVLQSVAADRALIEECMAAVDVPDVIDRGAARVTDAANGVYVEFNREYHIIPEITLTSRSGTGNPTAAELHGSPTLLGFTARLRDTVTGQYTTGTFTWASHGY